MATPVGATFSDSGRSLKQEYPTGTADNVPARAPARIDNNPRRAAVNVLVAHLAIRLEHLCTGHYRVNGRRHA